MDRVLVYAWILALLSVSSLSEVGSIRFKIVNNCRHTIWLGILTGANSPALRPTGFVLKSRESRTLSVPKSWSGRVWARTLCSSDGSGKFSCTTGDCDSGKIECSGNGATPPATLVDFTLNGDQGLDFYVVSVVDGFNLPVLVVARGGTRGGCASTGCLVDLNAACPAELAVARANSTTYIACRSACLASGDPKYRCIGEYSTADKCPPSIYSQFFKHACPGAYSYTYDDRTSIFTCAAADYTIMFCPPPCTSRRSAKEMKAPTNSSNEKPGRIRVASKVAAHGSSSRRGPVALSTAEGPGTVSDDSSWNCFPSAIGYAAVASLTLFLILPFHG